MFIARPLVLSTTVLRSLLLCSALFAFTFGAKAQDDPFIVKADLFDQSEPDSMGLTRAAGTETYTIYQPTDTTNKFSNGAAMIAFKDQLYCMWQSSALDEDASDTYVAYSRSADGITWTEPMVLAESIPDGYCSSGGWWSDGDTLVAYINTWPESIVPRGGFTRYTTSSDGLTWTTIKPLLMADGDTLQGIFEQDPHALPDGRILNAAHFQPGINAAPIYTDDPSGKGGWVRADFTNLSTGSVSREIEPSWYLRHDGAAVMIFRDQNGTYKKLAAVSLDQGESWTTPVLTDMPDSRSKQSAGNIGDSTAYFVSNPNNDNLRVPLAVTLSKDGYWFNTAYVLRTGGTDLQPLIYEGTAKKAGYHYPKSMIWNDYLYVAYTTNKEDVEYTRVPLSSLVLDDSEPPSAVFSVEDVPNIQIYAGPDRQIRIVQPDGFEPGAVSVFTIEGQQIFMGKVQGAETLVDLPGQAPGTYVVEVQTARGKIAQLVILP